jgi:hypothetical protein
MYLNTLSCNTENGITNALDFGIYGSFSRQNNTNELKPGKMLFEIFKHRLNLINSDCVFTEAGLTQNWHSGVGTDALQLCGKSSEKIGNQNGANLAKKLIFC